MCCEFYLQTPKGSQLLFSLGAILPHTFLKGYLFLEITFKIRHGCKSVGADSPK